MALSRFSQNDERLGQLVSVGGRQATIQAMVQVDALGNEVPFSGVPVSNSSGNKANAVATATLPAVAAKTNYLTGFEITFAGATAASVVLATVTGGFGGTLTYVVAVPAGAAVSGQPLLVSFSAPLPASAANTAIAVSLPALGAGNTNACVNARGFLK